MDSVLLIIERPSPAEAGEAQSWLLLQQELATDITTDTGIQRIAENLLQIPLRNGLSSFARILVKIESRGFAYRALFFEQPPKWLTGGA